MGSPLRESTTLARLGFLLQGLVIEPTQAHFRRDHGGWFGLAPRFIPSPGRTLQDPLSTQSVQEYLGQAKILPLAEKPCHFATSVEARTHSGGSIS